MGNVLCGQDSGLLPKGNSGSGLCGDDETVGICGEDYPPARRLRSVCGEDDSELVTVLPESKKREHSQISRRFQRSICGEEFDSDGLSIRQRQVSNRLEAAITELFRLHDLSRCGMLKEDDLVKLNEKIAVLHRGKDADLTAVDRRYRALFRSRLNIDGDPVPYSTFREYMVNLLDSLDPDERTQELIVEQFCAEAFLARTALAQQPSPCRRPSSLGFVDGGLAEADEVASQASPARSTSGGAFGSLSSGCSVAGSPTRESSRGWVAAKEAGARDAARGVVGIATPERFCGGGQQGPSVQSWGSTPQGDHLAGALHPRTPERARAEPGRYLSAVASCYSPAGKENATYRVNNSSLSTSASGSSLAFGTYTALTPTTVLTPPRLPGLSDNPGASLSARGPAMAGPPGSPSIAPPSYTSTPPQRLERIGYAPMPVVTASTCHSPAQNGGGGAFTWAAPLLPGSAS